MASFFHRTHREPAHTVVLSASMRTLLFLSALSICLSAAQTRAAIIFDNGGPDGVNGRVSQLAPGFGNQTADDFTIAAATTVESMTVFFFQNSGPGAPENALSFDVRFYNNVGSDPAVNAFATTSSGGPVTGTDSGVDFADRDIFAYQFDLATPLPLGPGTYWVSPIVSGGNTFTHFWATSGAGSGSGDHRREPPNEGAQWILGGAENAFRLDSAAVDSVIPEPSTHLIWIALGLAGAGVRRREYRHKAKVRA